MQGQKSGNVSPFAQRSKMTGGRVSIVLAAPFRVSFKGEQLSLKGRQLSLKGERVRHREHVRHDGGGDRSPFKGRCFPFKESYSGNAERCSFIRETTLKGALPSRIQTSFSWRSSCRSQSQ